MLPPALLQRVQLWLKTQSRNSSIQSTNPVSGGCIHHAIKLVTSTDTYFLKWNESPLHGMFSSEANGLGLIRSTRTIHTPEVYTVFDGPADNCPSFILLEWIDHQGRQFPDPALLGENLALLHRSIQPDHLYGLESDNYLGSSSQPNAWRSDWISFFQEYRLGYQIQLAIQNGRLTTSLRDKLEKLNVQLPGYLAGTPFQPSLLHGDLWSGNILSGENFVPWVIDPAVYYGDREAEIAYTELFGGFPARFYQAYNAIWPLEYGYAERRSIYNLYHLLNHLNIFGESYAGAVNSVVRTYLGN